ncbi:MAG: hypothetical protein GY862_26995 [Gammaproteobacteria bacterium]|nr:hypothetical protein [Gammaproteobacteria bacterium]
MKVKYFRARLEAKSAKLSLSGLPPIVQFAATATAGAAILKEAADTPAWVFKRSKPEISKPMAFIWRLIKKSKARSQTTIEITNVGNCVVDIPKSKVDQIIGDLECKGAIKVIQ